MNDPTRQESSLREERARLKRDPENASMCISGTIWGSVSTQYTDTGTQLSRSATPIFFAFLFFVSLSPQSISAA